MMSNKEESKSQRVIGYVEEPTRDTLSEREIESDDDQSPVWRKGNSCRYDTNGNRKKVLDKENYSQELQALIYLLLKQSLHNNY